MFNKSLKNEWLVEDLRRNIILVQGEAFQNEMAESAGVDALSLKINQKYPTYKTVGGVHLESGFVLLLPCSLREILSLLGDFLDKTKKEPFQSLEALARWAEFFGWPPPDSEKCEGYILNYEMIRFTADAKGSALIFKYKDTQEDTFFLYSISVLAAGRNFYFLIRRYN